VALLRRASEPLLDHLETVGGDSILLNEDYYRAIAPDQVHDVYVEPSAFTVGLLSECLEHLEQIVEDPSRSISFGLVWLADLLRAAGQTVVR
jgi:hypothetical protein